MRRSLLISFATLFFIPVTFGQHTVGLTQFSPDAAEGYILFAPLGNTHTYLIDRCGKQVKNWNSLYMPGVAATLEPDGTLLRTANIPNTTFGAGGGRGGLLERFDWDGNLIWSYQISNDSLCMHHDFTVLPNGNIIVVAWERHDSLDAVMHGKIPYQTGQDVWSERLIELHPFGPNEAIITWQWSLWDHLVQHVDPGLPSFASPSDHPELMDINQADVIPGNPDWIHVNSVSYNAALDQVMVSAHAQSELWIIDHGTTTAEAAGHMGGARGHGGDLLYRWGNPRIYGRGQISDQQLFSQHHATWIAPGFPHAGSILVFNNGVARPAGNYSSADIIEPPFSEPDGYTLQPATPFGPNAAVVSITAPEPTELFSPYIGGVFPTEVGYLITDGVSGEFLQFDVKDSIIWRYWDPVTASGPMTQGDPQQNNNVFRAIYYAPGYIGFTGHDLTPGSEIELDPTPSLCLDAAVSELSSLHFSGYPDPTTGPYHIRVAVSFGDIVHVLLTDMKGAQVLDMIRQGHEIDLDLSALQAGSYILRLSDNMGHVAHQMVIRTP